MSQQPIQHVLPGEPGGDWSWFARQNPFEQQEIHRQVGYRRRRWPDLPSGAWSKRPNDFYPHILPPGSERLAFYPPLADAILAYLDGEDIALHSEALNLKSSQVACLNILYPLRCDPALARATFGQSIPDLVDVIGIEFEYTGPDGTTEWLGEPARGKRGQNRTSIDAALVWLDRAGRRRASLIEWKYTERNFGVCSAFTNAGSAEQRRCLELRVTDDHPETSCPLTDGGDGRHRRYWEHLTGAGIPKEAFAGVKGCPFAGPLYQLMRQQLLAAYLVQAGEVEAADLLVLSFSGNTALDELPASLEPLRLARNDTIIDVWNRALAGASPVHHLTVEGLMAAVDQTAMAYAGWRDYVRERYGA